MSSTILSEFEELVDKATSETIPNGEIDLPVSLEVSDIIRSKKIAPRECMRLLKKRIISSNNNPNRQLSSWRLVEICIKNGGIPFIVEICCREFMDFLENTIIKYNNENNELENLTKKIFYELYIAFENDSQLRYVSIVYGRLINKGITFSNNLTSNITDAKAMFESKVPAEWIDSDACMICSNKFSFLNRRHHCRSCGGIFCQEHSSHFIALPDLGIYENVRVCDNCYNDYDSKKHSSGSGSSNSSSKHKKTKRKEKKHLRHTDHNNDEDEEEQIRRAIELSLRESRGQPIEPIVPIVNTQSNNTKSSTEQNSNKYPEYEKENDPDLKAAIEASLKEAEKEKIRQEREQQSYTETSINEPSVPSFELSPEDEDAIYLFAAMVEKMKTQTVAEILQNDAVQKLYQQILSARPKLNHTLANTNQQYNSLLEMNGKISNIMNIYDHFLEKQLQNINLSSQYTIPSPLPVIEQPQPQLQPQVQVHPNLQNSNLISDPSTYYQETISKVPTEQSMRQPSIAAPTQIKQSSTLDQLRDVNIPPQNSASVISSNQLPYPTESQESLDEKLEPSEPVYPEEDEEKQVLQKEKETNEKNSILNDQDTTYPTNKTKITHYDFPTVPIQKLPEQPNTIEADKEKEDQPQKEEPILLEL